MHTIYHYNKTYTHDTKHPTLTFIPYKPTQLKIIPAIGHTEFDGLGSDLDIGLLLRNPLLLLILITIKIMRKIITNVKYINNYTYNVINMPTITLCVLIFKLES